MRLVSLLAAAGMALAAAPALAVPIDGFFIAQQACPAFQSFRNQTNPGGILVEPWRAYELVEANRTDPTHYRMVVPGVEPQLRWVAVDCGFRVVRPAADAEPENPTEPGEGPRETQYVFAASWQPGFCETRPDKDECTSQVDGRFDTLNLSLHGLWPQRVDYCGVSDEDRETDRNSQWDDLPAVTLGAATRTELEKVMPGSQSFLERHEWIKHGTCYGADASAEAMEEYFADSLAVMTALNSSAVGELFRTNVGREISREEIRSAFDAAFGTGAGERVRIACKRDGNRQIITELTIGLTGVVDGPATVGDLILAASPTDGGCPAGIVDPAGLQ